MENFKRLVLFNVLFFILINGCSTSSKDPEMSDEMAANNEYQRAYSPVNGPADAEITLVDFSGFL